MIEIKKYQQEDKEIWNDFLKRSKIDTFLFDRNFMDYHTDHFFDQSFIVYKKGKIEAIFPGNIKNDIFYSHEGLTYGGLVPSVNMSTQDIMHTFNLVNEELKKATVKEVIYKPVPFIYHLQPSQEDIYALYRLNAKKIGCAISSTISGGNKVSFAESRKSGIRKAIREEIIVGESNELEAFWKILENNLKQIYNKKPVHNIAEIHRLKATFPNQIKLYVARNRNELLGGCLVFIMKKTTVHVQYISASEHGKHLGALDLLFDTLINDVFSAYPFFDFGHSTEQMGNYLNHNLIFQKEGFGGRGVVYEIYKYKI